MPKADDYGWTTTTENDQARIGQTDVEAVSSRTAAPHESQSLHSPLPWRVDTELYHGTLLVEIQHADGAADDQEVCAFTSPDAIATRDAAFIVTAVNSHDALLAALKAFGRYDGEGLPLCYDWCHEYGHKVHTPKCIATRAAIALAEGR